MSDVRESDETDRHDTRVMEKESDKKESNKAKGDVEEGDEEAVYNSKITGVFVLLKRTGYNPRYIQYVLLHYVTFCF